MPPLLWRNEAQGKRERQSEMVVASKLNSLDLKRNLCFGALTAHSSYISANRSLKKPVGLELFASAKVERATFFSPQWYRRFPKASRQRRPSRMERLAASWIKAMTANCSLKPNLREDRPVLCLASSF